MQTARQGSANAVPRRAVLMKGVNHVQSVRAVVMWCIHGSELSGSSDITWFHRTMETSNTRSEGVR